MRLTGFRKFARDESGFSLVFVGLGCMAFVAASMLAIDVGMLMTARSQAQNAADAGALAGATALAFDDWNDRSATGPAVVNAIAAAQANKVIGETVSVAPADVEFVNDPTGQPSRVRVHVWRNAAHNNPVSTLVAQYFGIKTADISAVAMAEASPANAMTCVKPFTIPDKWIEKNPVTAPWSTSVDFSRYDKKGNLLSPADVYEPAYVGPDGAKVANPNYSGYNSEQNRGVKLVLRASNANNIQPSFYFSLAMTDDTGGDDYRWNIANCNHTIYNWGDMLVQEPGAKEGPTVDGITDLIAKDPNAVWDESTNRVKNSAFGDRQSPRVFPIPLYDPDYYDYGKQTGRVASLKTANWIGFFVEYIGNGSEIHGRIIPIGGIRDKTSNLGIPSFPKAIRLVQ
jgi:Flp pilus assembly protein TadG